MTASQLEFSVVTGFFHQSEADTQISTFDYVCAKHVDRMIISLTIAGEGGLRSDQKSL